MASAIADYRTEGELPSSGARNSGRRWSVAVPPGNELPTCTILLFSFLSYSPFLFTYFLSVANGKRRSSVGAPSSGYHKFSRRESLAAIDESSMPLLTSFLVHGN